MVLSPTLFSCSRVAAGPKHSTTVPSSAGPLSVDEKEVALVANPVPGAAVKARLPSIGPQEALPVDRCARVQKLLLPFTLQMVVPLPFTVHLKVMVPPGHVERAGNNCPATKQDPGDNIPCKIFLIPRTQISSNFQCADYSSLCKWCGCIKCVFYI